VIIVLFVGACILIPIFFMDSREPIVRLEFSDSPAKIGKPFDLKTVIQWLEFQAERQGAKRATFAFVVHETYMTDKEIELFEREKNRFLETGQCHFVLISGPGGIHRRHFHIENHILKEITEELEPITLP
jgi:hypothetical protein